MTVRCLVYHRSRNVMSVVNDLQGEQLFHVSAVDTPTQKRLAVQRK